MVCAASVKSFRIGQWADRHNVPHKGRFGRQVQSGQKDQEAADNHGAWWAARQVGVAKLGNIL